MATEPVNNPKIAPFPATKIAPLLRALAESDEDAGPDDDRLQAAERVTSNLATSEEGLD